MEKYKIVVALNKDSKYYWALTNENKETLSVSETYDTKQDVMNVVGIIKKFAASAEVFDLTGEE